MIEVFTPSSGDPILVDIVGDLSVDSTAELTDYPVEDGTSRTDHKIINPDSVTLTIKQTETPIDDPQYEMLPLEFEVEPNRVKVISPFLLLGGLLDTGLDTLSNAIGLGPKVEKKLSYQTLTPRDRGAELHDRLKDLLGSADTCSVSYKGRSVPNLSVVGVNKTDTTGEAGHTTFQVSLRELRTVQLTSIALPNPADLAMKPAKAVGKKPAPEVPVEDVPVKSRSVLKAVVDLAAG